MVYLLRSNASTASAQSSGVAERGTGDLGDRRVHCIPVLGPRCRNETGSDRVDPDRAVTLRQQQRHLIERRLGHRVRHRRAERSQPGDRGDVDDVRVVGLSQVRDRPLGQPPRTEHVDVERLAEDLVGEIVEAGVWDRRGPAGVVDQEVELARMSLEGVVDQCVGFVLIADVGAHVARLTRQRRRDRLTGLDRRRRVDHDRGAERREPPRSLLADAYQLDLHPTNRAKRERELFAHPVYTARATCEMIPYVLQPFF